VRTHHLSFSYAHLVKHRGDVGWDGPTQSRKSMTTRTGCTSKVNGPLPTGRHNQSMENSSSSIAEMQMIPCPKARPLHHPLLIPCQNPLPRKKTTLHCTNLLMDMNPTSLPSEMSSSTSSPKNCVFTDKSTGRSPLLWRCTCGGGGRLSSRSEDQCLTRS
jgi:hypothetical protein